MASTFIAITLVLTGLAALIATVSLLRGPEPQTRMVAADALTLVTMPMVVALAIITGRGIFVDIALVYALLSFLGVISVARYFDKGL